MPPEVCLSEKNKTLLIVILKLANMDGDALSTVSVDSAADKDVSKSKKPRATRKELAAKRTAELADLKGVNLSLLTEAKRSITSCAHEFQLHAISIAGKWSIIAFEFNNGFIVSKEKFATGATEDVRFEPLSKAEHKPDDALSRKWEKVTLNFRMILCSKLDDSVQLKVIACASRSCATAYRSCLREPLVRGGTARSCAFIGAIVRVMRFIYSTNHYIQKSRGLK